mmetsp:Transcript_5117/g.8563  ORF Transcript_5117/g.8563 Transcript_5117/m.8563 type:complete len:218 (+) Transcript_5117:486-1139(+)
MTLDMNKCTMMLASSTSRMTMPTEALHTQQTMPGPVLPHAPTHTLLGNGEGVSTGNILSIPKEKELFARLARELHLRDVTLRVRKSLGFLCARPAARSVDCDERVAMCRHDPAQAAGSILRGFEAEKLVVHSRRIVGTSCCVEWQAAMGSNFHLRLALVRVGDLMRILLRAHTEVVARVESVISRLKTYFEVRDDAARNLLLLKGEIRFNPFNGFIP